MQTPKRLVKKYHCNWLSGTAIIACLCAMWNQTAKADDLPGLSAQLLTNNQVQLTVTNGVATNTYEIYKRFAFDSLYPWTLHIVGTNGQTNFTADRGIDVQGFYQARVGYDSDGDGVPNWKDADPYSSSIGVLTITIDNPINGSVFQ